MYPLPGHLSLSLLGHRYFGAGIIAVIVGAMMPDLIDKPLNDVLHITPYGRCFLHSFLGLAMATLLARRLFNRDVAYGYFIGHVSHLIGDAEFNPWFWPFLTYQWPSGIDVLDIMRKPAMIFFPSWIIMETMILALALFLYSRYAEKKSIQTAVLITILAISIYRITRIRENYLEH